MNYFDKIRKLLNVQELGKRRLEQMEKEKKLDSYLQEANNECPDLVFQYLMKTREINRKYAKETYSATVFEYPDKAIQNLDMVDKMYSKYSIDCPRKICSQLPELLKELKS